MISTLQLRLFQVTPSEKLLNQSAQSAALALLDSALIDDESLRKRLFQASTVRDLLACFETSDKDGNRRMTLALHNVLSSLDSSIAGIRCSVAYESVTTPILS